MVLNARLPQPETPFKIKPITLPASHPNSPAPSTRPPQAARATVLHEVQAVFGAYGIGVDPRHLGLIADFMTHQGAYRACNRIGIESSVSPFLKMSFETAAHFLTDATLRHAADDMRTPSARLCVGRVVELGTGVCSVNMNNMS